MYPHHINILKDIVRKSGSTWKSMLMETNTRSLEVFSIGFKSSQGLWTFNQLARVKK